MNDIKNLVIDNYPQIENFKIITEFPIDYNEEISISINNSNILNKEDIISVKNNIIEFSKNIEITKSDIVAVIYYTINNNKSGVTNG